METIKTEGQVRFKKQNGLIALKVSVIPAMDSYEDDILIRLQLSNDLVLPVRDSGHQVILELQLLPHLLHDVLEEPEEDRVLTWTGQVGAWIFSNISPYLY